MLKKGYTSYVGLVLFLGWGVLSKPADALEVFAKGSYTKSYISQDKFTTSLSTTVGFAFSLFPSVRVEGRYTRIGSLQNRNDISGVGSLTDLSTRTSIYSVGIDIDIFGPRSSFQPFIFVGAGYIVTERDFYFTDLGGASTFYREPRNFGLSANGGAGIRVRLAKSFAFELEAYAYSTDFHEKQPLINIYGTAGIRFFF